MQPSYCEGMGNAVVEAMSRGCVPIVSRFSAQPEVVSNFGYVVNEICKKEIAKKIQVYLDLPIEKKNILRNNVLDFSHEKFSFNLHLKKLKNILSE